MSVELNDEPLSCSTPARRKNKSESSRVSISESEADRLSDWSLDWDGIRLDSEVCDHSRGSQFGVSSQVLSVTSTVANSENPLFSLVDRTLISLNSESDFPDVFSDCDSLQNTVSTSLSLSADDVFSEAVSEIELQNLDFDAPIDSTREHCELVFEAPLDLDVEGRRSASSDTSKDSIESDSRPSTRTSVVTAVRMPQTNKEKYLKAYRQSVMIWNDSFKRFNKNIILPRQYEGIIDEIAKFCSGL